MTENSDHLLYCRRKAPVSVTSAGKAIFPVVHEDEWCGDFREEVDA
jgi:hypothetical protein